MPRDEFLSRSEPRGIDGPDFPSQGKRRPAPMTLTLEHRGRTRVWRHPSTLMLAAGIALVTIGLLAIGLTLALFFKEDILQSLANAGAQERSHKRSRSPRSAPRSTR